MLLKEDLELLKKAFPAIEINHIIHFFSFLKQDDNKFFQAFLNKTRKFDSGGYCSYKGVIGAEIH